MHRCPKCLAPNRCSEYTFYMNPSSRVALAFWKMNQFTLCTIVQSPLPTELLHLSKIWDLDHTPPCLTVIQDTESGNHEVMWVIWIRCLALNFAPLASPCSSQHCTQLLSCSESQSSFSHNNPPKLSVKTNSSKQLSFLLNVLLKRFSQKDQSPCHHQTLQILLSLLLLSSPQLKTKQKTVSYLTKTPKSSRPYNSHSQKYPSFPSSNDASCLKISTHLLLANEDFCP